MPLAERAASAVLSRQAHALALRKQSPKGQRLGSRPIEAAAAFEHRFLGVEDPLKRLVDVDFGGTRCQELADASNLVLGDGRLDVAAAKHRLVGTLQARPAA